MVWDLPFGVCVDAGWHLGKGTYWIAELKGLQVSAIHDRGRLTMWSIRAWRVVSTSLVSRSISLFSRSFSAARWATFRSFSCSFSFTLCFRPRAGDCSLCLRFLFLPRSPCSSSSSWASELWLDSGEQGLWPLLMILPGPGSSASQTREAGSRVVKLFSSSCSVSGGWAYVPPFSSEDSTSCRSSYQASSSQLDSVPKEKGSGSAAISG